MAKLYAKQNGKLVPCECCNQPTCTSCGHCCFHRDSVMTIEGADVPATGDVVLDAAIAAWGSSSKELLYTPNRYVGCGDYSLVVPFAVGETNYRLVVYVSIESIGGATPIEAGQPVTRAYVEEYGEYGWSEYGELWSSDSEYGEDAQQDCCGVEFPSLLSGVVGTISGNLCCKDSEGNCTDAEGEGDCAGNCFWDCAPQCQCCVSRYSWVDVRTTGNLSITYSGSDQYVLEGLSQYHALDLSHFRLGTSLGNPSFSYYYVLETDKVVVGDYEVWLKIQGNWNLFVDDGVSTSCAVYWVADIMRRSTGVGSGSAYRTLIQASMNDLGGMVNGSCCGGTCPVYLQAAFSDSNFAWADGLSYAGNGHRSTHTVMNNPCCADPEGGCGDPASEGRCNPEMDEDGDPTGRPFDTATDGWCNCECLCPPDLPSSLNVNWIEYVYDEETEEYDAIPHSQVITYDAESCSYSGGGLLLAWNPTAYYCGRWEWYEGAEVVSVNQGNGCISPVGYYSGANEYEVTE